MVVTSFNAVRNVRLSEYIPWRQTAGTEALLDEEENDQTDPISGMTHNL